MFIHPEVKNDVVAEFNRLKGNNPHADDSKIMKLAQGFVSALQKYETANFKDQWFKEVIRGK